MERSNRTTDAAARSSRDRPRAGCSASPVRVGGAPGCPRRQTVPVSLLLRERSGVLPTLVPGVVRSILRAPVGFRRAIGTGNRRLSYPQSPQFAEGLFHNRLPMTVVEQGSRTGMAREFATKGRTGKPKRPVDVVRPELPGGGCGSRCDLARSCDRAARGRRAPRAHRPGLERAGLAVGERGAAPQPPGAAAGGRPAPAGRRPHLPRPLRPPRHRDHRRARRDPGRAVRGAARRGAAPRALEGAGRPDRRARLGPGPRGRRRSR